MKGGKPLGLKRAMGWAAGTLMQQMKLGVRGSYAGWYELGIAEWCNGKGNKTAALNALEKAREDRSWRQMAEYEIDKIKNPAKYEE